MKEAIKKLINHIIFEIKTDYNKLLSRNYSSLGLYINYIIFLITYIVIVPIYIMAVIFTIFIILIIKTIYNRRMSNFIIKKHLL
jgi:hypothetical protein